MSPSGNDDDEKEDEVVSIKHDKHESVYKYLPPTITWHMQVIFIRLLISQIVEENLVEDQRIDYSETLASLSNERLLQSVM